MSLRPLARRSRAGVFRRSMNRVTGQFPFETVVRSKSLSAGERSRSCWHRLEFGRLEFRPASDHILICAERRRCHEREVTRGIFSTTRGGRPPGAPRPLRTARAKRCAPPRSPRRPRSRVGGAGDRRAARGRARAAVGASDARDAVAIVESTSVSRRASLAAARPRPGWPRSPPPARAPPRPRPGAGGGAHARELRRGGGGRRRAACSWSSSRRGARSARSWSRPGAAAPQSCARRDTCRRRSRA